MAIVKTRDDRELTESVPSHVSDQYKLWFLALVSDFTAVLIVIHYFTLGMHSAGLRILPTLLRKTSRITSICLLSRKTLPDRSCLLFLLRVQYQRPSGDVDNTI